MRKGIFTALLLLTTILQTFSQERYTVSGRIRDVADGEVLIGASVRVDSLKTGAATNEYGFYSISLPEGAHELEYHYIGYQHHRVRIRLQKDTSITIELEARASTLEEVVVTAQREDENVKSMEMSTVKMDINTIQKMPALLGEVDIVKSLQMLPGVSSVGEGAAGFNVRGGGIDQNLVLLDEAPVYNTSHLFGVFSVFNPDAVKDVKLIKGGIPSQYGGRISSMLDVRMKDGSNKKLEMNGGIGSIFARIAVEGPIVKEKGSFILAGRRSYMDLFTRAFIEDLKDTRFNFYDLTLKANYKTGKRDHLYLSGYLGRDVFGQGTDFGFDNGNRTVTLRWNHVFGKKLFLNTSAIYSHYDYGFFAGDIQIDGVDWSSDIINYSVKPEFTWFLNNRNTLKFGGQGIFYLFKPVNARVSSGTTLNDISMDNQYAREGAVYISNEQQLGDRWMLEYGLRYSLFQYMGDVAYTFADTVPGAEKRLESVARSDSRGVIKSYGNLEPRVAVKYDTGPTSSVKASYNRMAQYLHLISNTSAAAPTDRWIPSNNNIKPQLADQLALGYFRNFLDNAWETSLEVYYKDMKNQIDYIDGADLLLNEHLDGSLLSGKGRAYGMELYVRKAKGRLTGWLSYTLARSERKVEGINRNNWYPNRFDQTHRLNLTGSYRLNKRWEFGANLVFSSGTPTTFPTNRIEIQGYVVPHNVYESRNNYRIPSYHRLDLSATFYPKKYEERKKWDAFWVFSLYNVYNRRNPFSVFFRSNEDHPTTTEAIKYSVFGSVVPAVSFNFSF